MIIREWSFGPKFFSFLFFSFSFFLCVYEEAIQRYAFFFFFDVEYLQRIFNVPLSSSEGKRKGKENGKGKGKGKGKG